MLEVRNDYIINVDKNGNVAPSNFSFGNYGESQVTRLTFNTIDLDWYNSNINNYQQLISFLDTSKEQDENNPLVYEFTGMSFDIPQEITTSTSTYTILYILKEIIDDTAQGNLDNPQKQEIFVTDEMSGRISGRNVIYDETYTFDYLQTITTNTDGMEDLVALVKEPILINIVDSDIELSSNILGNKFDQYIKYVQLEDEVELEYVYVVFVLDEERYIVKLDDNKRAFIPKEVTAKDGNWIVGLIATDLISKMYVSNEVRCVVEDNYLIDIDNLIPNRTIENSNLFTSDNLYLVSSDNYTINAKEV